METKETTMLLPVHLDENECLSTRGGDGTWDKEVVKYVGFGLGYGAKKIVKALQFLSKNLYESQSRSMVIYK